MNRVFAGIWIDHRVAIVIAFDADGAGPTIARIESGLDPRRKPRGRSGGGHAGGLSHTGLDERRRMELKRYYGEVLKAVKGTTRLAILGPGNAKLELEAAIARDKSLRLELDPLETAGRMTESQLVARFRECCPAVGDTSRQIRRKEA